MDNVLIVVDDLEAAKAFFAELGMELEGETQVEGPSVDSTVGLDGVRADIAMMRTPDGHGRVELSKFHTPPAVRAEPEDAPANTLGIRRIMFAVDDIDDVVARLRSHGAELVGEMAQYEDSYRLCFLRGPDGHHHRTGRAAQLKPARARAAWRTRWSRSATFVARAGGLDVRHGGSGQVAVELVQVAADGMPSVAVAEHLAQPIGLEQPRGGTEDVADRDRAAEHGGGVLAHRVVGEGDEVVVPGEDLRPVGLLGAGRVVVQGGDGGLDLVAPGALGGQRRLQDAHALGDLAGVPQATVLAVERDDATL